MLPFCLSSPQFRPHTQQQIIWIREFFCRDFSESSTATDDKIWQNNLQNTGRNKLPGSLKIPRKSAEALLETQGQEAFSLKSPRREWWMAMRASIGGSLYRLSFVHCSTCGDRRSPESRTPLAGLGLHLLVYTHPGESENDASLHTGNSRARGAHEAPGFSALCRCRRLPEGLEERKQNHFDSGLQQRPRSQAMESFPSRAPLPSTYRRRGRGGGGVSPTHAHVPIKAAPRDRLVRPRPQPVAMAAPRGPETAAETHRTLVLSQIAPGIMSRGLRILKAKRPSLL